MLHCDVFSAKLSSLTVVEHKKLVYPWYERDTSF